MTPRNLECDLVRADLGEFALGIVSGRTRSRVSEHLVTCAACREELEALSAVSDRLVQLAPQTEAPLGFESRLLERYNEQVVAAPRRRPYYLALAAAARLLVVAGVGIGHYTHSPHNSLAGPANETPISATLSSQGRHLGHLWMSPGTPAWIYMSLDDANFSGTAWCSVTLKSGRVIDVGVFSVRHGYGAWAARVNTTTAAVKSAQVTDATGRVLASATLST